MCWLGINGTMHSLTIVYPQSRIDRYTSQIEFIGIFDQKEQSVTWGYQDKTRTDSKDSNNVPSCFNNCKLKN